MVWYGYGMVWYGMVWYGMIRGVVWCGVVWCGVVWCGVVWYGMAWLSLVWLGLVWYAIAWNGMVRCVRDRTSQLCCHHLAQLLGEKARKPFWYTESSVVLGTPCLSWNLSLARNKWYDT